MPELRREEGIKGTRRPLDGLDRGGPAKIGSQEVRLAQINFLATEEKKKDRKQC